MAVTASREGAVTVASLTGELDLAGVDSARQALEQMLDDKPEHLVLDLSGLSFMDSSGIALLLSVTGRVRRLEVRNPSVAVRRLIEVTGLGDALPIVQR